MKTLRILSLPMLLLFCSSLTEVCGQNRLLRELAKEDKDYRRGRKVARTDQERGDIVLSLIGQGELKVPEDKANAALVLQHTGLTFCDKRLVSRSPDNYLLAHHLAKSAFESGYKEARYLVAQTIDRHLSFTQGYQKYGTQRLNDPETGKEEWVPIDRKTTDDERAKYGVPPLDELLKQYPERASEEKPQD